MIAGDIKAKRQEFGDAWDHRWQPYEQSRQDMAVRGQSERIGRLAITREGE